jgi:polysaccharide biosynthesis/export protein
VKRIMQSIKRVGVALLVSGLAACSILGGSELPSAQTSARAVVPNDVNYRIGTGDNLNVFVWRNPDFTVTVPVRPDGRVSIPLVEDLVAVGKTPKELANEIELALSTYIRDPIVTVMVTEFVGTFSEQVRVVGEAGRPMALSYRQGMTLLDVMIAVGGLTEFAAGNRAALVRSEGGKQKEYRVRIADLLKDGDVSANVEMRPGDVLIIPETWF